MVSSAGSWFTRARRDKNKCTLFCFRSYVEDSALLISLLGILGCVLGLLTDGGHSGHHYALGLCIWLLANIANLLAQSTGIAAFYAPWMIIQSLFIISLLHAIVLLVPLVLHNYNIAFLLDNDPHNIRLTYRPNVPANSENELAALQLRLNALISLLLVSLLLLFSLWLLSIVWRAFSVLQWKKIVNKLAAETQQREQSKNNAEQKGQKAETSGQVEMGTNKGAGTFVPMATAPPQPPEAPSTYPALA